MEYSLALQTISSQTNQQKVDKIQNHALRFISGGMKSTPTAACEIHTNIEPMQIRREAAVVETIERYKRQSEDHPNRKVIEEPRSAQRIKKKSIMSVAEELREKYTLPEDREPIYLFDASYNFDSYKKFANIRKELIDNAKNKK